MIELPQDPPPAYLVIKDWSREAPYLYSVLELSFFRYVVLYDGKFLGVKRGLRSALRLARQHNTREIY